MTFLDFHVNHADLANRLARAVTDTNMPRRSAAELLLELSVSPLSNEPKPLASRLDAAPDNRLRFHGDPTGARQAPRNSADVGAAVEGVAVSVSAGRGGR